LKGSLSQRSDPAEWAIGFVRGRARVSKAREEGAQAEPGAHRPCPRMEGFQVMFVGRERRGWWNTVVRPGCVSWQGSSLAGNALKPARRAR